MTREEFINTAMKILLTQRIRMIDDEELFDSDNIDNYKVAQYDDDEWDVEAAMGFESFLDELYEAIKEN